MDINLKVPAIEKLLDYAASGIGSIAGPMLASWKAQQEANAKLIAAEGEAEAQGILAEGQSQAMQIIAGAQADARAVLVSPDAAVQGQLNFGAAVSQRIQFQEEKRLSNSAAVIGQTAQKLGDRAVQDHEVDHDWTARFFNDVQDVSSEEMQSLWAKILAGEVERPGSTSIRTLNILKDLNRSTATIFRTLCSARIAFQFGQLRGTPRNVGNEIVLSLGGKAALNALQQFGLSFDALNVLNEYGLIIPEYNSSLEQKIFTDVSKSDGSLRSVSMAFRFQGHSWVLVPTDQLAGVQSIELRGIVLTRSGMELARVVALEPMPEYEKAVVDFYQQNGFRMVEVNPQTLQAF